MQFTAGSVYFLCSVSPSICREAILRQMEEKLRDFSKSIIPVMICIPFRQGTAPVSLWRVQPPVRSCFFSARSTSIIAWSMAVSCAFTESRFSADASVSNASTRACTEQMPQALSAVWAGRSKYDCQLRLTVYYVLRSLR